MPFYAGASTEVNPSEYKRYVGIAPVKVLAVNPSSDELAEIYGKGPTDEPTYVSEKQDADGNLVKNARVTFIIKTDASVVGTDGKPIDHIARLTFFLRKQYRKNRDGSKVQVIDKYGNHMGWPTTEEIKQHVYPLKSAAGKPLRVDTSYRPCIDGEDKLTDFIKEWLNIPALERYQDGQWIMRPDPEKSEARLDAPIKFFDGDFSELKAILGMTDADGKPVKNHTVKVLFGVRTGDDNKLYQEVYNSAFARGYSNSYGQIAKDLENDKAQGRFANIEFKIQELKEYEDKPSAIPARQELPIPEPVKPVSELTSADLDNNLHKDDLPFGDDMPDFGDLPL